MEGEGVQEERREGERRSPTRLAFSLLCTALTLLLITHAFAHRSFSVSFSFQSEPIHPPHDHHGHHHGHHHGKPHGPLDERFKALNGFCSSVPAITEGEMSQRRNKVASLLKEFGYQAYITEPGPSMRYFSGVSWKLSERPFLLVIPVDAPYFFASPSFEEGKARELIGANTTLVLWEEDESPYDLVFRTLGSPDGGKTLAIDHETRFFIQDGLRDAFGSSNKVLNGLDIVRNTRGLKSKAEIDIMRCINIATKKVIATVSGLLYEGITEDETATLMKEGLQAAGLSNVWHLVLFAENAAFPHGTTNRIPLQNGQLILIDAGGELYGYQSDISRTFPFGTYSEWQENMWNTVRKAQQAALDSIKLGGSMSSLDEAARQVTVEAGYGNDYDSFTHRLGHGIGLQGHEEMYAVRGNAYPITPGMCFSVEPGLYIVGKGGVRIEDIVCVTDQPPFYELFGPTSDSIDNPFQDH